MTIRATYRLQFHTQFTFRDAAELAPYFAELGISHIYASPISESRKGSMHGYDVVDPSKISRERGGETAFFKMAEAFRAHGLGIILDIVPNHMAACAENPWWMDVLENGPSSRYAGYFDIDWQSEDPDLRGKVLAPFLSAPYHDALNKGLIRLVFDEQTRKLLVAHYEHRFPIRALDQNELLGPGEAPTEIELTKWNRPETLNCLIERQNYVLSWWRTANDRINWRRFFDISSLAAIRIEEPEVFEAVHALPFALYRRGLIDGVRIDHVDGLADPEGYCRSLRARFAVLQKGRSISSAEPAWIIVEKILGAGETLPPSWEVDGTTGYDFMHEVSALQHTQTGGVALDTLWQRISGSAQSFAALARETRSEVLQTMFSAQLRQCTNAFLDCRDAGRVHDLSESLMSRALTDVLSALRVYRSYSSSEEDLALSEALNRASASVPEDDAFATAFLGEVLARAKQGEGRALKAATRFHQLSATLAAKAVEDTAFYRYGRLLSRNEVGSDPDIFSLPTHAFHESARQRARNYPRTMLATATHDTKRGEDSRARLSVLSEIPALWAQTTSEWFAMIAPLNSPLIEDDTLYMLLQTIVGVWPFELRPDDGAGLAALHARLKLYVEKALREAKRRTSWVRIDAAYEAAAQDLLAVILDPVRSAPLLDSLANFVARIAPAGAAKSLVQTALRLTLPGIPDLYQGTEYWDLSLVDPDNRRPVDFAARRASLETTVETAMATWRSGIVKQLLIRQLLTLRAQEPLLFQSLDYQPLAARGERAAHLFGFVRRHQDRFLVVTAARHCADALFGADALVPTPGWWGDTSITLTDREVPPMRSVLSNEICRFKDLRPSDCLSKFPAGVFLST